MKKFLLTLCLFSMTSHAEWELNNFNGKIASYFDTSRIRTEGQYKSMWYLLEYLSPQTYPSGKQYKSRVSKALIDCQASKIQTVAFYFYSEAMGKGDIVSADNFQTKESYWIYSPPNSFEEDYINIACGKK